MRLAFKLGQNPLLHPIEAAIDFRTNSPICHVELLFSNGETFSTDLTAGARYTNGSQIAPGAWDCVDLGPLDEQAIRERCDLLRGVPYDTIGIFAFLLDVKDPDCGSHAFCSSLCVEILQKAAGIFKFALPSETSPGALYLMAKAREEKYSQQPLTKS